MRIAELADRVGIPTTTVRYYERIGLLPPPVRTAAGYRDYDDDAASRLLFIARARKMGISCDQITDLLPIWDSADCGAAHQRVSELVDAKRAEIADRMAELEEFAAELQSVKDVLDAAPPPTTCCTDLSCCVPESGGSEPVALGRTRRRSPQRQ